MRKTWKLFIMTAETYLPGCVVPPTPFFSPASYLFLSSSTALLPSFSSLSSSWSFPLVFFSFYFLLVYRSLFPLFVSFFLSRSLSSHHAISLLPLHLIHASVSSFLKPDAFFHYHCVGMWERYYFFFQSVFLVFRFISMCDSLACKSSRRNISADQHERVPARLGEKFATLHFFP